MKIKIPKIEYVEKEVYSKNYEEVIKGIKALKDLGFDIRYDKTLDEKGWEIRIYIRPGGLCGHIHKGKWEEKLICKGKWEEKHIYNVETIPVWSKRFEVEPILERLYDTIELYNVLSVSDLYAFIRYFEPTFEYVPNYTDNKYGWTKTNQLRIVRKREGYTIGYDDPKLLE